jgi:hypothetical protein
MTSVLFLEFAVGAVVDWQVKFIVGSHWFCIYVQCMSQKTGHEVANKDFEIPLES